MLPFGSIIWNLSTTPVPLWGSIGIGRPKPFPSIRPSLSFPFEKDKEEKKGFTCFFHVNGPILYRKAFRAIHHVEKDQPPTYRTLFVPRKGGPPYDATDGCPKCVQGVNSDSDRIVRARPFGCHILAEFIVPTGPMLGGHNLFLRFTAVTPEIKGFTRAPVLRRGGKT